MLCCYLSITLICNASQAKVEIKVLFISQTRMSSFHTSTFRHSYKDKRFVLNNVHFKVCLRANLLFSVALILQSKAFQLLYIMTLSWKQKREQEQLKVNKLLALHYAKLSWKMNVRDSDSCFEDVMHGDLVTQMKHFRNWGVEHELQWVWLW